MKISIYREHITHEKLADAIDETQWSQDFERENVDALALYLKHYKVPRGIHIFDEGDTEHYMGIILSGKVEIAKSTIDGHLVSLAILNPGKVFGEMSIADHCPRSASAIAATEVTLAALTEENFNAMIEEKPKLAVELLKKIIRMLSLRLRHTSSQLIDALDHQD